MRIGIMGDTHGDVFSMQQAIAEAGPVERWLHTGDFFRDSLLLATIVSVPVTAVAGNCDGRAEAKPDEFIEVAGYRLWLTHGHRYGVKNDLSELREWALLYEADVVVFGHTHQPFVGNESGLLFFNPGSPAMPRRGRSRTCGVLELISERSGQIEFIPRLISIC